MKLSQYINMSEFQLKLKDEELAKLKQMLKTLDLDKKNFLCKLTNFDKKKKKEIDEVKRNYEVQLQKSQSIVASLTAKIEEISTELKLAQKEKDSGNEKNGNQSKLYSSLKEEYNKIIKKSDSDLKDLEFKLIYCNRHKNEQIDEMKKIHEFQIKEFDKKLDSLYAKMDDINKKLKKAYKKNDAANERIRDQSKRYSSLEDRYIEKVKKLYRISSENKSFQKQIKELNL